MRRGKFPSSAHGAAMRAEGAFCRLHAPARPECWTCMQRLMGTQTVLGGRNPGPPIARQYSTLCKVWNAWVIANQSPK